MTNGKFLLVLGLNALVSLAITLGVTDFTLNQREKMEDLPLSFSAVEYTNPEADVIRYQANLDEGLSKYSGVEVFDAYKLNDIAEAKLQIEEGKRFCKASNSSLVKIKFYRMTSPYIKCSNGVTDK
ncbi:hypothetical protein GFIDFPLM_00151 [Salmonella phage CRW-SP5]|uniref:Uncharacterized protein n=1 Tax=Salmonella phage JNwz02 TaxID=2861003 RepID=A0AC61NQK8_9CAUD|nr:hypothetical protein [Salmonella phage JNwz02]WNO24821.1 hypothetical protein KFBOJEHC_00136 [Salmonella phage PRF-SP12]WPJ68844.1 hypothetical protein NHPHFPKK_00151 [Salmonella phage STP-SP9]WPJ72445.1 hypothetical protein GFIDFPLM_00151 [Salmonella phage CRW-SP5]WPJ72599.1 hypothetical protein MMIECLLD_00151 [Salmonella phage CRW-SP6]